MSRKQKPPATPVMCRTSPAISGAAPTRCQLRETSVGSRSMAFVVTTLTFLPHTLQHRTAVLVKHVCMQSNQEDASNTSALLQRV